MPHVSARLRIDLILRADRSETFVGLPKVLLIFAVYATGVIRPRHRQGQLDACNAHFTRRAAGRLRSRKTRGRCRLGAVAAVELKTNVFPESLLNAGENAAAFTAVRLLG